MTQKEFETLKTGDEVIIQRSGELNGQKAVVKSISTSSVVVLMETGMYLVFSYHKLK